MLFKEGSAKDIVFDVCYSKGNTKGTRVIINCSVTSECNMSKDWDLRFVCYHESFCGAVCKIFGAFEKMISESSESGNIENRNRGTTI